MGWLRTLREVRGSLGLSPGGEGRRRVGVACRPRRLTNQSRLCWGGWRRPSCLPQRLLGARGYQGWREGPARGWGHATGPAAPQDGQATFWRPPQPSLLVYAAIPCLSLFSPFVFSMALFPTLLNFVLPFISNSFFSPLLVS